MEAFVFDSYSIDATKTVLTFVYKAGGGQLVEKIYLPKPIPESVDRGTLNSILFSTHLALGISYWKMKCIPRIEIKSGVLSKDQAQFWNTVYTKGLGEFYYRNKIDFRGLVSFPFSEQVDPRPTELTLSSRSLVGIGGGKDSLVTWERLKKEGISTMGLIIETQKKYPLLNALLKVSEIPAICVRREMDKKLIEQKNNSFIHNGHIPISMIYAWIGVLVSLIYDYSAFVVSNERSADEGNTQMHGMIINHQWSKSREFEELFTAYVHTSISPSISYYSPLRELTELEIVREFVSYPQYFSVFSSCNRNFSVTNGLFEKRWCGKCPKCAFAFLLFAAYLPKEKVLAIFEKNILEDSTLVGIFRDLLGQGGLKPFECVGTFEEAKQAMKMIVERGEFKIPEGIKV